MHFKQSKLATHIEIDFKEDELEYSMKDNSNNISFELSYKSLPKQSQTFYERNLWLRNVGLLWLLIGISLTVVNFSQGNIVVNFWTWIGLICLALFRYTWADYTYFDTQEGRILILQDSQSDNILDEIKNRRKKVFLDWFDRLEFENNDQIKQSLDYLIQEKILSRSEADERLSAMHSGERLRMLSSSNGPPNQVH